MATLTDVGGVAWHHAMAMTMLVIMLVDAAADDADNGFDGFCHKYVVSLLMLLLAMVVVIVMMVLTMRVAGSQFDDDGNVGRGGHVWLMWNISLCES